MSSVIWSRGLSLGLLVAAFFLCSHMYLCVYLCPDHLFKKKQLFDLFFHLFIYFWLKILFHCFPQAFSSCTVGDYFLHSGFCFSLGWLLCCRAQALRHMGPVVVVHRFSYHSIWNLPDQGSTYVAYTGRQTLLSTEPYLKSDYLFL